MKNAPIWLFVRMLDEGNDADLRISVFAYALAKPVNVADPRTTRRYVYCPENSDHILRGAFQSIRQSTPNVCLALWLPGADFEWFTSLEVVI